MKRKISISMISAMMLGGPLLNMDLAHAEDETEDPVTLEDVVNQEVGELEFSFVGAKEVESAPNSPISTKLEGLDTDEPVVRFIWDREDESSDEVFELTLSEIDPVEVEAFNKEDEGTKTHEATVLAEFETTEDDSYYQNTEMYLIDGEDGIELLQPNYAGNVEEDQQDVYMNLIESTPDTSNLEALDEAVIEWGETLEQDYGRYYPGFEEEFSHAGTDLDTMLENAVIDDEPVNLKESDEYEIIAIYSGTVEEESMIRDITYIMTIVDETPVVLVTEQMEDASEIHYTETENTDLQGIYYDWLEKNQ